MYARYLSLAYIYQRLYCHGPRRAHDNDNLNDKFVVVLGYTVRNPAVPLSPVTWTPLCILYHDRARFKLANRSLSLALLTWHLSWVANSAYWVSQCNAPNHLPHRQHSKRYHEQRQMLALRWQWPWPWHHPLCHPRSSLTLFYGSLVRSQCIIQLRPVITISGRHVHQHTQG
jgi:hypothetical protein